MYDVLSELSILSEALQNRNVTVVYSDTLIRRSMRLLENMKIRKGKYVTLAESAISNMKFESTQLTDSKKIIPIKSGQLLTSLVNNMEKRLLTTHDRCPNIISELMILDHNSWPAEIPLGFGESELESSCKRFSLSYSKTLNAFRDFVDCNDD